MADTFDLVVIGAGPGGYVAAIRAAQLGMRVACVEKQELGGTCLNVGCIPSKALLDSSEEFHKARHLLSRHGIRVGEVSLDLPAMMARKDKVVSGMVGGVGFLFKKNKVEHVRGVARILSAGKVEVAGAEGGTTVLHAARILIATGSEPIGLPTMPFDGRHIVSSTEALTFDAVPGRLVVIGAGAVGLELGSVWRRLGSEVVVLEFMDRIMPLMDREMTGALRRSLEKQGLRFRLSTTAKSATIEDGRVEVAWASGEQGGVEEADRVLVAIGRRPATDGLGLAELKIETDRKGFVVVDERFGTSVPNIYAIGDVIGGAMLAHKAEEEGVAAVERMAGRAGHVNYRAVANVVYTDPELASVGMTEEEARSAGEVRVGKFPLLANGRARAMDATEGLVKVIADAKTDRLLGMHILSARASDLIAEGAIAMEFGASVEDIARSVHAHPTLPEAIKEAALAAAGRAVHV